MMTWEQAKNLPIGHVWHHLDLWKYFAAIAGGVAYPGKRPGFAVVAGLRPVENERYHEIHVLDEAESSDLGELLRLCHGLIPKYHGLPDQRFGWFGDWENTAAQTLIRDVNGAGGAPQSTDLDIQSSPVLDMEAPYPFIVARIHGYTLDKQKMLHLRNGLLESRLRELPLDGLSELPFGSYPAAEALAFVVEGLREEAQRLWNAMAHPHDHYENVNW